MVDTHNLETIFLPQNALQPPSRKRMKNADKKNAKEINSSSAYLVVTHNLETKFSAQNTECCALI